MNAPSPIVVDEHRAAELTGISVSSLRKLRITGGGPRFAKLGNRVRYRVCDLETYIEDRVVSSTSELQAA